MAGKTRRRFISSFLAFFLFPASARAVMNIMAGSDYGSAFEPVYLGLHRSGELKKRAADLWETMRRCALCPRECGAKRLDGEKGFCGADSRLEVASYHPHFGEERPLVGKGGSGTIFLTHCSLRCVFCINSDISQGGAGHPRSIADMAGMMLKLQEKGCHNINMVTPTHYSPHILLALDMAAQKGLRLPLVYNTSGWERLDILKILDGAVDIYLPDFKYFSGEMAARYSAGAKTYPEIAKKAMIEMNRQAGTARSGSDGIVRKGVMIRHLVMPNGVSGSPEVMRWIGANLPKDTYVNIMSQYRPCFRTSEFPEIDCGIKRSEYDEAIRAAMDAGLTNIDIQGYSIF